MPFDTPPGQVLSSVPSPDRRRTSKLGGCASVLFQIFNGKRLFHRKSLPAERPKQSPNTHTEEQGPVKTLLTVADESLSISYRDTDEASETESAYKVEDIQTFDENVPSRSVGVVARLMGLETMPPLGSSYCECKHFEQQPKVDDSTSGDAPQWDRRTSKEKAVRQSNSSLSRSITREFKTDLPAKFAARRREKIKDSRLKSKFAFNGSSVSPEHFNSAFPLSLSSAKDGSLIKSGSFHKSIVPTQKDTSVVEAPPKMLDSTLQVNCPAKIQLQSTVSRNIHGSGNPATKCSGQDVLLDPNKQQTTAAIQVPYNKRNESKPTIASTRLTMDNRLSRQKNPYFHKPLSTQHAAGKIKCPIDEATLVRRQQQSFDQPKVNIAENVKPCLRRQQEISSRLIQPTVCSALKIQRARSRHPSPPKSVQDSSGPACSSQDSNCVPSSYDCPLASHLSKSQVGSNVVSAGKLFSTSEKVSHRHIEDLNDFVHAALPLHHASRERADVHRKNVTTMHIADFSQSDDSENSLYSHFSQDRLISSVIYTESLQKSSLETSISSDPSLSKSISSSEDSLNSLTADERNVDWESEHGKYPDMQNAFNLFSCESSSESLSSSLSVSMDDTASSHSQVDTNGNNIKSGSLCPGKNAAAILQELITALSSSRSQGKSNDTESDQIAPYCTEVGRSHSLADCVQHKIILSTESTSEGAECSYSLESVQHSQGIIRQTSLKLLKKAL
ncbi:hypothetical protein KP509_35G067600 [Ceratopteris richardii]|uniref:DUF3741 domain-containing protein n=1 Tax=Ceratopteris richardii TaxID=49495 RepID=A0A8T2QI91_CERRI|nr:hypothetical protein KP509_35G067600 [Ceratopteris richardii]